MQIRMPNFVTAIIYKINISKKQRRALVKDNELKKGTIYWAEIVDSDKNNLFGQQLKLKFTGILFRNIEHPFECYFLSQLKIFKEYKEVKE